MGRSGRASSTLARAVGILLSLFLAVPAAHAALPNGTQTMQASWANGTSTLTGFATDFTFTNNTGGPLVGDTTYGGFYDNNSTADNTTTWTVNADGTNLASFDLTAASFPNVYGAFGGGVNPTYSFTFTGYKVGGGTVTTTGTMATNPTGVNYTWTTAPNFTSFTGITGFQVSFNDQGAGSNNANIDFGSFTVANATPPPPTVTDGNISISGASGTGGAYKIGDTVTATWDNTASGDNNSGITGVTVDFSQFGGGSAVTASNSSGTWTATYTIPSGSIDGTNKNVSVTATNSGGSTTTADTTNATVDNIAPTVTDANISISGGTGAGGAYQIGDTVTATWDNTATGDNNSDTIAGVTVDFSQFGGGSAVTASNSSGTWTATYTIVAGTINSTNRNISVTATDNAGNTTTAADTTNATVDNIVGPTITSATYDVSTGVLAVTGSGMTSGDTIDPSKLTLTGYGGTTYTLTSSSITASSSTTFSVTLNSADQLQVDSIFNKNGTAAADATTYNLAAASNWDTTTTSSADLINAVVVSNVATPTITSATYDASTGNLAVIGTGFLSYSGSNNDIVANKFTFTGEGGATYTLTNTSNADITNSTSFTLNLSSTDKAAVNLILNKNGTISTGGTTYNLAAAQGWDAGADPAASIADLTGNGITVSNVVSAAPGTPGITGISPTTGPTTGGTPVTITGSNFAAPATVSIGGAAATKVVVVSATQITAVTPAGTAGKVNVAVTTPGGTTTATGLFTYVFLPDPAKDPEVIGLVNAQEQTAQQFWQAQVFNFQRHLESLHHSIGTSPVPSGSSVASAGGRTLGRAAQRKAPIQLAENDVVSDVPSAASVFYTLASVMQNSSLNVNLASFAGGAPVSASPGGDGLDFWGAGNVRFGTQKQQSSNSNIDYTTNGVSLGVDKPINEHLTLGLGVGYGHNRSTFGSNGTENTSNGYNLTVYGSYQPVTAMYLDGLLGYGTLRMNSNRYVTLSGGTAHSDRTGSQLYGALIAGYEYHHNNLLVSPYVRYVFGEDRLAAATETGAGIYSLNYGSQTFRSQQAMLALRVGSQYNMTFGTMSPHARIGYQHQFTGTSQSTVSYADFIGTRYSLVSPGNNKNSILIGAGSNFALHNGLNIDLGYQWESASGSAINQAIYARLSKDF